MQIKIIILFLQSLTCSLFYFKPNSLQMAYRLLAAKEYYFGVGGSIAAFEEFVTKQNCFSIETVHTITEGKKKCFGNNFCASNYALNIAYFNCYFIIKICFSGLARKILCLRYLSSHEPT